MINNTYVPGIGSGSARIAIVGEAPSYEEIAVIKPFVGPSGRFLDSLLHSVGINRSECWVTNVCKYFVTPNPKFGKKIPFQVRANNDGIDLDVQIHDFRK